MAARLSDSHARNARPKDKAYKLVDGNGLFLLVKPNGKRSWRYRYRIGGIENMFAVGDYPQLGLKQARAARDDARLLVEQGTHPSEQRKADRLIVVSSAASTFKAISQEWISENKERWSAYYLRQVETILANEVYPHIGRLPMRKVHASHLLGILKRVAGRDAPTVAILIRQWCSAIFRYAVANLKADSDPSAALKGAISRPRVKHKRPLEASELRQLSERLEQTRSSASIGIAIRLLLLTFVRPGELRCAAWSEFDLGAKEWRIPAERMKMREAHIVPLSTQAVALLNELQKHGVMREQLFPNVRDPKRCMSPTTLNRSLERMGYSGKFSAHGFRATASTLLNEMGYRPDVIERQLAHGERNQVRASYNRAAYMAERRTMMQAWADFIDDRVIATHD
jgi:integrase